jgi:hypothetical protein
MSTVAKRFLSRCPAAAQRHSLLDRKFISVGIDQFHFASHDVRTVLDCLDCYLSHAGILKHQIPNPKLAAVVQDRERLGGSVVQALTRKFQVVAQASSLWGKQPSRLLDLQWRAGCPPAPQTRCLCYEAARWIFGVSAAFVRKKIHDGCGPRPRRVCRRKKILVRRVRCKGMESFPVSGAEFFVR